MQTPRAPVVGVIGRFRPFLLVPASSPSPRLYAAVSFSCIRPYAFKAVLCTVYCVLGTRTMRCESADFFDGLPAIDNPGSRLASPRDESIRSRKRISGLPSPIPRVGTANSVAAERRHAIAWWREPQVTIPRWPAQPRKGRHLFRRSMTLLPCRPCRG